MLNPFLSLQAILLSSDGHNLVTGGDNGVVEVWQACDFKQLYIYPGCDAGVRAMDLSHDQRSEQAVCMVDNLIVVMSLCIVLYQFLRLKRKCKSHSKDLYILVHDKNGTVWDVVSAWLCRIIAWACVFMCLCFLCAYMCVKKFRLQYCTVCVG